MVVVIVMVVVDIDGLGCLKDEKCSFIGISASDELEEKVQADTIATMGT
jgi:hypothetical protein